LFYSTGHEHFYGNYIPVAAAIKSQYRVITKIFMGDATICSAVIAYFIVGRRAEVASRKGKGLANYSSGTISLES
jgi:hypothetical protein